MSDTEQVVENDLDAFETEFYGKAAPAKPDEAVEELVEVEAEELETENDEAEADAEAPDDDSVDDADDDEEEVPVKKNRKTASERIRELNTKLRESERENARRIADLEARLTTPKEAKPQEVSALSQDAPTPDATKEDGTQLYPLGEFDPTYIRDLTRFTIKQEQEYADTVRRERQQQEAVTTARAQMQQEWNDKLATAEKEIPDIRESIADLGETFSDVNESYGQYLIDVVMSLEAGPAVLKYLADNPKAARDLVNSGAASATIALGRLDARMAKAAEKPAPKKVTKAPAPPAKVSRGTSGQFHKAADTDDLDAFESIFYAKKK